MATLDPFNARRTLSVGGDYYSLAGLDEQGIDTSSLPYSIRILLEGALRGNDGFLVSETDIRNIAGWTPHGERGEIPFRPSRVILQDFTGVPAVVDLAALRDAMVEMGGDPEKVNPQVPVDLVIDHSVQVDIDGANSQALDMNLDIEYHRNMERYTFLKWGQQSLANFQAVPPSRGIVHQVNLEYLASVARQEDGVWLADTLVGTDSHTTMINGLGVLGWGVGGIEAEAVMLGQPIYMLAPDVVGVRLIGELNPSVTATDMTLRIVEMLREHGVVGKFVEFFGAGMVALTLADRATIANMAPEYGATWQQLPTWLQNMVQPVVSSPSMNAPSITCDSAAVKTMRLLAWKPMHERKDCGMRPAMLRRHTLRPSNLICPPFSQLLLVQSDRKTVLILLI